MPADGETLRVVHVVRQFSPCVGGLEDAVANLARHQRDVQGIDASVLTLDRAFTAPGVTLPPSGTVDGIPVRRLPWRGSTRYPVAPGVVRAVRDADLVHVHAIDFFFDALAVTRAIHRRPMIASTHGGFFHTGAGPLKRLYFRTVTRASCQAYHAIVACSASDAAMFAPVAGRRLVTIENGVDVAKFADRAARQPARRIITFGRFASHKRIDRLFLLLAALRPYGDWRLTVAGSPGDQTDADLAAQAQAAGVRDHVSFVVQPSQDELARCIGDASYFASASAHEGFGLAAVEALSAGLLPVLSAIAPFAALIKRAGQGVLFDPEDLPEAARRLAAIDAQGGPDAACRARLMAAAAGYAWPSAARAYADLYQAALQSPTPAAAIVAT